MKPKPGSTTIMECCGKEIRRELISESGIAFAVWTCPECGSEAEQVLAEINPEKARIKR